MKNKLTRILSLAIMTIMMITMSTSCGPARPKPEDAQNYVQAVLDLLCTGDYDHSVVLYDIEEGKEGELREEVIEEAVKALGDLGLNEENEQLFKEYISDAFKKAKYTIGDAVATDDEGGYDVTVSIEPLKLFEGLDDAEVEAQLEEKLMANIDKLLAMSESEQNNYAIKLTIELMKEKLENPSYGEPVEVTVHYGLLDEEENAYGCSEEEGQKLGEQLFSE